MSVWTKNSVLNILDENVPRDTLLKKFASGELAMFLASGITQIGSPKDTNEFTVGVAPFPTPKAGQIYVTQKQIKYAEFIPAPKATDAAKILFIRNEIYRLASRFKDRDIQLKYRNILRLNSLEMKCLANLKFNNNEYKSYVNLIAYAERQNAEIKTEDIVNKVVKEGKDAQWAIDTYGLQLEQEYLSAWKDYIITAK